MWTYPKAVFVSDVDNDKRLGYVGRVEPALEFCGWYPDWFSHCAWIWLDWRLLVVVCTRRQKLGWSWSREGRKEEKGKQGWIYKFFFKVFSFYLFILFFNFLIFMNFLLVLAWHMNKVRFSSALLYDIQGKEEEEEKEKKKITAHQQPQRIKDSSSSSSASCSMAKRRYHLDSEFIRLILDAPSQKS